MLRHWIVFFVPQLISNNALWNSNIEMPNYLLITELHTKVSLDHLQGKKANIQVIYNAVVDTVVNA